MCCGMFCTIFLFEQKTAYEVRISDWSADVCSSDLSLSFRRKRANDRIGGLEESSAISLVPIILGMQSVRRSEEHTSELQSLMRISYAVFCLKKKNKKNTTTTKRITHNVSI